MKQSFWQQVIVSILLIGFISLNFQSCASPRYLSKVEVKENVSIKVYLNDGSTLEGLVQSRKSDEITLVAESDHQPHTIKFSEIRRIEQINKHYDDLAYPISEAEIQKYKTNRNAWGYGIGGAAIGALGGLLLGLPFWYADVSTVPPYFVAGIGAVAGSIFFTTKGIKKDREIAIEKIRFVRARERELEAQKKAEEEKLRELKRQKEELLKKLQEKKIKAPKNSEQ